MTKYNDEYYIAFRPNDDTQVHIKPDKRTALRKYHYKKLENGGDPLFFTNGFSEEEKTSDLLTDLVVDTSGLLINKKLKDELSQYTIDGVQIYPSIYIDNANNDHGNYWYLGLYTELNCLDLTRSKIEIFDFDDDDDDDFLEVKQYYLNEAVLNHINEESRLIFKVANCSKSYLFFHKSIVEFISKENFSGVNFIRVSDFNEGDQF
ncbi:hypothetical protein PVK64_20375 [Aliivibrio sp. S4TY2]|uniref:imm11 family protein n=1 Tax=unclassified Aliivibrio TaxID=2645654 RepID=UPI002379E629|nr:MULTISPECIES: DUF1629 domain-containing protein [unclassified Aliivibrio]MDD9158520.1 hypothetical protein [Aliivibrio sp. S4TY2]MDD9162520.1 hypothetical protein [Aliivibrio sp. S4TY1]MDD9166519.1 hypothetical protein [Aliivibrio sp. S4MY2]MDD9170517.1 hypothetical protein [Aliivibrio sp. S4MY4]MDD9187596.1 hypothetical protein [Aliivibrio sp. S4MY3]